MQLGLQILVNICQKLFVQNNFFAYVPLTSARTAYSNKIEDFSGILLLLDFYNLYFWAYYVDMLNNPQLSRLHMQN